MAQRLPTHQSGMAGEFSVMETLYRLGHEPALTLGNAKSVDILLELSSGRTIRISVKTVRGGGKWGIGNADLSSERDLFFVLLYYARFADVSTRPQAFVIPAPEVQRLKEEWFDSYAVYFSNKERRKRIEPYRDAWHLLGE